MQFSWTRLELRALFRIIDFATYGYPLLIPDHSIPYLRWVFIHVRQILWKNWKGNIFLQMPQRSRVDLHAFYSVVFNPPYFWKYSLSLRTEVKLKTKFHSPKQSAQVKVRSLISPDWASSLLCTCTMQSYKSCNFPFKQRKRLYSNTVLPTEMQPALPTADRLHYCFYHSAQAKPKSHPQNQKKKKCSTLTGQLWLSAILTAEVLHSYRVLHPSRHHA